ncbi:Essential protein Yae1, N terminal [Sporothrix eucalyptigena]
MHQRPPADPNNKDDLLAPAGVSFATMDPSPNAGAVAISPLDETEPAVDANTVYHGEAGGDGASGDHGSSHHAVDLFDDVFGTSPTSGEGHHYRDGHNSPSGAATASSPTIPSTTAGLHGHRDHHPSDMNRLQQDHSTAGYREGLSAGKNATLQAGFDEGYPLGAALGTMVGGLLGLLEGLVVALPSDSVPSSSTGGDAESLSTLLARARQELTARSIYSTEYFAPDGTWTYDMEEQDGQESTIYDVAGAHPLIKTWRGIVDRQLDRRGIRWGKPGEEAALAAALGLKDEEDGEEAGHSHAASKADATTSPRPDAPAASRAPPNNASALDW